MTPARFDAITSRYPSLRVAVVGDLCLDRYFDIDPEQQEISIETGLPVHNIRGVRCQPGGAGTILNNLAALGTGTLRPVGLCGDDGEGWELRRALAARPGVDLSGILTASGRHTFTYTKPLVHRVGRPPEELSRLDLKNWTPTPAPLRAALSEAMAAAVAGPACHCTSRWPEKSWAGTWDHWSSKLPWPWPRSRCATCSPASWESIRGWPAPGPSCWRCFRCFSLRRCSRSATPRPRPGA